MAPLLAALAGCGGAAPAGTSAGGTASSTSASSSTSSSASSASSSSTPQVRTLEVAVTGKQVTPAPARVTLRQGERLRLVVTIDHDDEIHVHGFEVEREAKAG